MYPFTKAGCHSTPQPSPINLLMIFAALCFFVLPAQAAPWPGSGTEEYPYLISDANDMNAIGADDSYWGAHFKLTADIDLSSYTGTEFNIIGSDLYHAFTGVFDGNSHVISNFTYTSTEKDYVGLFGCVGGADAEVRSLGLWDPNVEATPSTAVGALAGKLKDGTITDCYVNGGRIYGSSFEGTSVNVGGLVGGVDGGLISNCYATTNASVKGYNCGGLVGFIGFGAVINNCYAEGTVTGDSEVGGLVGFSNPDTTISNCYSLSSVSGNHSVGGLVGWYYGKVTNCYSAGEVEGEDQVGGLAGGSGGAVSNCYATGSVSGDSLVGGLVGYLWAGTVSCCYSTGSVTGAVEVGGLVGHNCHNGVILDSFWDIQSSGLSNMCGLEHGGGTGCNNGNGKTTTEMQDPDTFDAAGWDFVGETTNGPNDIWKICCGRAVYPKLAWEEWEYIFLGDFVAPDGVDIIDFSFLAEYWSDSGLGMCSGADITGDGAVDMKDVVVFSEYWLQEIDERLYHVSLSTDPGWTTEGEWAFGQPTGQGGEIWCNPDPSRGHTGKNVYGVNLNGDYSTVVGGPYYLTTGPFDCTGYSNVKLKFARWLNTEWCYFVGAKIEVSNDGSSWDVAWEHTEYTEIADDSWQNVQYDISATADGEASVYIRWSYEIIQSNACPCSGWNIDDIQLLGDQ